jgi:hypothetical protein
MCEERGNTGVRSEGCRDLTAPPRPATTQALLCGDVHCNNGSTMPVSMMQIRIVRMGVDQPGMSVVVDVRFARRINGTMAMLMMFVMHMGVGMCHGLMDMIMFVPLDEVKIEPDPHQNSSEDKSGSDRLAEHDEREQRADKRCGREIRPGPRGAKMAQRQHE